MADSDKHDPIAYRVRAKLSIFDEKRTSLIPRNPFDRKYLLKILPMLIILLALPIGVYLALHPQIFSPQADEQFSGEHISVEPLKSLLIYTSILKSQGTIDYQQIINDTKDLGLTSIVVMSAGCSSADGDAATRPAGCNDEDYYSFVKGLGEASLTNSIKIIPTLPNYGTIQKTVPDYEATIAIIDSLINPNVIGFYYPDEEANLASNPVTQRIRQYLHQRNLFLLHIPYDYFPSTVRATPAYTTVADAFDVITLQNGLPEHDSKVLNLRTVKDWPEGGVEFELRPNAQFDGDLNDSNLSAQENGIRNTVRRLKEVQNWYDQLYLTKQNPPKHLTVYWYEGMKTLPITQTLLKQYLKGSLYEVTTTPQNATVNQPVTYQVTGEPFDPNNIAQIDIYVDDVLKKSCTSFAQACSFPQTYTSAGNHTYYAKLYNSQYFSFPEYKEASVISLTPKTLTIGGEAVGGFSNPSPTPTPSPSASPKPSSSPLSSPTLVPTLPNPVPSPSPTAKVPTPKPSSVAVKQSSPIAAAQPTSPPSPTEGPGLAFQRTVSRNQAETNNKEPELIRERESSSPIPTPSPESRNGVVQTFQNIITTFTNLRDSINNFINKELFLGK